MRVLPASAWPFKRDVSLCARPSAAVEADAPYAFAQRVACCSSHLCVGVFACMWVWYGRATDTRNLFAWAVVGAAGLRMGGGVSWDQMLGFRWPRTLLGSVIFNPFLVMCWQCVRFVCMCVCV